MTEQKKKNTNKGSVKQSRDNKRVYRDYSHSPRNRVLPETSQQSGPSTVPNPKQKEK